jgi:beta-N-acetylhexosaminidase
MASHWVAEPFDLSRDLTDVAAVWHATFGKAGWDLPDERLAQLLDRDNAAHFVVRTADRVVGFCATYTHALGPTTLAPTERAINGYLSILIVDPSYQGRGVGSTLHVHATEHLRAQPRIKTIALGSCFPRFFPGLPTNLPQKDQDWFARRGKLGDGSAAPYLSRLTYLSVTG